MRYLSWLIDKKYAEPPREKRILLSEAEVRNKFDDLIRAPEFEHVFERLVRERRERSLQSLAIVSLEEGEGKTLIAALIAYACSKLLREKVLIIDTQTQSRKGALRLDVIFESEDGPPRADGTRGTFQLHVDLLKLTDLQAKAPVDLAYQIDALIDSFSEKYDTIILDTGSTRGTRSFDPIVLANRTQAALLVTTLKAMDSRKMRDWKAKRPIVGGRLLGVVLNDGGV